MSYNLEPNIITEIIKDVPTLTNLTILGIIKDSESAYKLIGENYVKNRFINKLYEVYVHHMADETITTSYFRGSIKIFYAENLKELYIKIMEYENFNYGSNKYVVTKFIHLDLHIGSKLGYINKKWRKIWKEYFIDKYSPEDYKEFWNIHKNNPEFINIQLEYIKRCHENKKHIYIDECNINGLF